MKILTFNEYLTEEYHEGDNVTTMPLYSHYFTRTGNDNLVKRSDGTGGFEQGDKLTDEQAKEFLETKQ